MEGAPVGLGCLALWRVCVAFETRRGLEGEEKGRTGRSVGFSPTLVNGRVDTLGCEIETLRKPEVDRDTRGSGMRVRIHRIWAGFPCYGWELDDVKLPGVRNHMCWVD